MGLPLRKILYIAWFAFIVAFAAFRCMHLNADFPNHTVWSGDWAKYTDEGWYSNAAVRSHLLGQWYLKGDFNPAVAVPVWPFFEWVLFFFTGVSLVAARGLAVAGFFLQLLLSYLLVRTSVPRWAAMLALTFMVTSPFLYCFSRLAVLEPFLMVFTLMALNLAVRLHRLRGPRLGAVVVGLLFAVMMLTKTYALFLLPALAWATFVPLRGRRRLAIECLLAEGCAFAAVYGFWLALIAGNGFFGDYRLFFFINNYPRPHEFYWPLVAFWWSIHGGLWADTILMPLSGIIVLTAIIAAAITWRTSSSRLRENLGTLARRLLLDPVFGSAIVAGAGTIVFMTYQNHPQPRYFAVTAVFCFIVVAIGATALFELALVAAASQRKLFKGAGVAVVAVSLVAVAANSMQTVTYVIHPEFTFVKAAEHLTGYIDAHPNGRRLLVSVSGDQIMLATHLPAICDDYGTMSLPNKLAAYQPGWYASWNDLDAGSLADLHTLYSLEQVADYPAFDDTDRNLLILFKLHPLAGGKVRDQARENLRIKLPGDKFNVEVDEE
ncbi:MAG TPA: glycosyltransferase family 39 protein [Terracidiphilus sp.]|nr:glycosyltransferase family 39 protein [Terracidiphilus sp.]